MVSHYLPFLIPWDGINSLRDTNEPCALLRLVVLAHRAFTAVRGGYVSRHRKW